MAWPTSNFPTSLDTITDKADSTDDVVAADINGAYDCIEKLEAKVGINSSAVNTSLDYLLRNTSSANPGHKHTLANSATDVTATAAELNVLDGIPAGLTVTEIGYVDGVTSNIQTQLDKMKYISLSGYKNLVIKTVADHASVDIDADYVLMMDTSGNLKMAAAVNLTVDLDVSAAINGRDAGSVAANQGWFLYVISDGTTTAGLASASATAPTMPGAYIYKALVGWCTTDETTTPFNVEEFMQIDDVYSWTTKQKVVDNGGGTTTTAINLAAGGALSYAVVPSSITKGIFGKAKNNTNNLEWFSDSLTFSNSISIDNYETEVSFLFNGGDHHQFSIMALRESQTFYHQVSGNTVDIWISGFTLKR
jgi:hypothetical protein